MNKVKVKFFGAFRKYVPTGESEMDLASTVTALEFRVLLKDHLAKVGNGFQESTLLDESALASEEKIYSDSDLIRGGALIAVLPPVCGG